MKTICYYSSSWFENIGNAFIDIGSMLSLSKALDENINEYRSIQTSMFPCLNYSYSTSLKIPFRLFWRLYGEKLSLTFLEREINNLKSCTNFNLATHIKPDVIVISGCVLTTFYFRVFGNILKRLKNKGAKFIFYGCGGNTYSNAEIENVSKWLDALQPYAIITRENLAYKNYKSFAEKSFDGIDCGFFVGELPLKGIEIDLSPYIVLTFDKFKNKKLEKKIFKNFSRNYNIVKASHVPHAEKTIFPVPKKDPQITLVSENPYDYLILYANAEKVYSDRIHACVVALAYGVPCRLYSNSPRVAIFSKIAENISRDVVQSKNLDKHKTKQLKFLSEVLLELS